MLFPVSGVETAWWIPPLVAFTVSLFTSMGGVSGAFLLLPFQVSVLGFTSPAVSPTNLVFNIVAIPSGVYRYLKEGRMAWPLTWIVCLGTLPGVIIGGVIRIKYLPDPAAFKFFAGLVLLYIGGRLLWQFLGRGKKAGADKAVEARFAERAAAAKAQRARRLSAGLPPEAVVKTVSASIRRIEYDFYGERFSFSVPGIFILAAVVGVVGGIYGIGGGAIIAPFVVAIFGLPVYTIAGAALMGTFLTSVVGVIWFMWFGPLIAPAGMAVQPDWALGALFGAGGFAGMYLGASLQKYVPAKWIKLLLGLVITSLAARYIAQFLV